MVQLFHLSPLLPLVVLGPFRFSLFSCWAASFLQSGVISLLFRHQVLIQSFAVYLHRLKASHGVTLIWFLSLSLNVTKENHRQQQDQESKQECSFFPTRELTQAGLLLGANFRETPQCYQLTTATRKGLELPPNPLKGTGRLQPLYAAPPAWGDRRSSGAGTAGGRRPAAEGLRPGRGESSPARRGWPPAPRAPSAGPAAASRRRTRAAGPPRPPRPRCCLPPPARRGAAPRPAAPARDTRPAAAAEPGATSPPAAPEAGERTRRRDGCPSRHRPVALPRRRPRMRGSSFRSPARFAKAEGNFPRPQWPKGRPWAGASFLLTASPQAAFLPGKSRAHQGPPPPRGDS